jgi:hypothetical protein
MTRAGTPATSVRGGTSLVTTAPAATDGVVADRDALEDRRARGEPRAAADVDRGDGDRAPARCRVERMARADQLHVRPDHHVVADVDATQVHRRAAVVDEHVAAEPQVAAAVGVERRQHADGGVECAAGQLAQERAHGVEASRRQRVEPPDDLPGALDVGAEVRRSLERRGPALRRGR